jgi:hypothetical protein
LPVKKVFASFSAAFAAVPGVGVLATGLSVPPDSKLMFGGLLEAFGTLVLLIVWINKAKVKSIDIQKLNRWCIVASAVSLSCLFVYIAAFNFCVVTHPYRGTVYFPLWTSGVARNMVTASGSRLASIDHYGLAAVEQAVQTSPVALAATSAVLILLYQGIMIPLTLLFGALAIRKGEEH